MLRLASDSDVHGGIVRGLRRRMPEIDLVLRIGEGALAEGSPSADTLSAHAADLFHRGRRRRV